MWFWPRSKKGLLLLVVINLKCFVLCTHTKQNTKCWSYVCDKTPLIQGFNTYFLFFQVSPNSTVSSYCIHYLLPSRITSAAVSGSAKQDYISCCLCLSGAVLDWSGLSDSTTTSGKTFHKRTVDGKNEWRWIFVRELGKTNLCGIPLGFFCRGISMSTWL